MKALLIVASVIVCATPSKAQITALLNPLADGTTEVKVRNDASVALAAIALSLRDTNGVFDSPLVAYFDAEVDAATAPLLPGHERLVREGRRSILRDGRRLFAVFRQPALTAGIYSDGSTTGDPALLTRLLLRRINMLLAVETSLEMLLGAGSRNVPRGQLIGQFSEMAESMNRWYVPAEQQVGRAVYQSMAARLMSLPKEPAGAPFPPSAFVMRETTRLNRQRVALLEAQPSLGGAFQISAR